MVDQQRSPFLVPLSPLFATLLFGLGSFVCSGCISTPRQNPYDQKNPGLKAEGRISGRINIVGALTQANHIVSLIDGKNSVVDAPTTDEAGAFLSAPLPAGIYRVVPTVPADNVPAERNGVEVVPGLTTDVGLVVSSQLPLTGQLSGVVRLEQSAESPTSVRITARRVGALGTSLSTTSNAAGEFAFTGLASGNYMVVAERIGFTPDVAFATVERLVDTAPTRAVRDSGMALALFPASAVVRFSVNGALGEQIGARYTRTAEIDLLLLAFGGVNEMRLSEQADFSDAGAGEGWQRFSAEQPFTLSEGEGEKRLYAQFRRLDEQGAELVRSDVYSTVIILDATSPVATLTVPGARSTPSGLALQSDGSAVPMRVDAFDELSPIVGLRFLHDTADPAVVPYDVLSAQSLVSVVERVSTLAGAGMHTARVQVVDAAGNASVVKDLAIELDQTPPSGLSIVLTGQAQFSPSTSVTRSTALSLAVTASGAHSMRFSQSSDLTGTSLQPYSPDAQPFLLLSGDGTKTVYVEVQDNAGNSAMGQQSIVLDTTPPIVPAVQVNDDVASTSSLLVPLRLTGLEVGGGVILSGDVLERGAYPAHAVPTDVTLLNAESSNTVVVVALDGAGNQAAPVAAVVAHDTLPPAAGTVVVAGGQATTSSLIVPISIRDTQAERMLFYEGDAVSCGSERACSDASFTAFAPNTALTLSAGPIGDRRVCWKFCDEAGNGTATSSVVLELKAYIDRPRPQLAALSPSSFVALSAATASLTVSGVGIAADTQLRLGDFTLPCENTGALSDCRVDQGGGCGAGGSCEASCGTQCVISSLPAEIVRNAGSYLARLETPAPVEGGVGTSINVSFFNVVSPVPTISRIFPRGVVQAVADDGTPIDQNPVVEIWGSHFMSNAVFRLGTRVGEVLELREDPPGSTGRYARVALSTAGLVPSDTQDAALSVINPTPGGGEASHPFGINPEVLVVPENDALASSLKRTRASNGMHEQLQAFSSEVPFHNMVSVSGGSYVELRRASSQRLLGRFSANNVGVPVLPGTEKVVVTADATKVQTALRVSGTNEFNSTGAFNSNSSTLVAAGPLGGATAVMKNGLTLAVVLNRDADRVTSVPCVGAGVCSANASYSTPQGPVAAALGDLDGDLHPDLVVASQGLPRLSIRFGGISGTFGPRSDLSTEIDFNGTTFSSPGEVALADVNGDGSLDIVMLDQNSQKHAFLVRYNNGSGAFVNYRFFSLPASLYYEQLVVQDLDRDGDLDVLTVSENSHELIFCRGDGAGGFGTAERQTLPTLDNVTKLRVADMNVDGALDVIFSSAVEVGPERYPIYIYKGDGLGSFSAFATATFTGPMPNSLAWSDDFDIADLNGDGYLDIVTNHGDYLVTYLGAGAAGLLDADATTAVGDLNPKQQVLSGGSNRLSGLMLVPQQGFGTSTGLLLTKNLSNWLMQFYPTVQPVSTQLVGLPVDNRPNRIIVADLNRDAHDDVVAADTVGNTLHTLRISSGGFSPSMSPVPLGYSTTSLTVHDINGDGMSDLLSLGTYGALDSIQQNLGEAGPAFDTDVTRHYDTSDDAALMAVADVTGDGRADVLVLDEAFNVQQFPFATPGAGDSYFSAGSTLSMGTADGIREFLVADLDLNGHPDLVLLTPTSLIVRRMSATYGTFLAPQSFALGGPDNRRMAVADFNDDGIPDVAVTARDSVFVRRGRLTPSYTLLSEESFAITNANTVGAIIARDVNGDGRHDLQVADTEKGTLQTRLNEGGMVFGARYSQALGAEPNDLGTVELGEDLVDEVVSASPTAKTVYGVQGNTHRPYQAWLRDIPDATLDIPAGTTTFGLGQGGVHSAMMLVDDISVSVRIEGSNLEQLTLSLVTPEGQVVLLNNNSGCGPSFAASSVLVAHYPTTPTCANFDTLDGWHAEGVWRLRIDNPAGVAAVLRDFELGLHGRYQNPSPRGRSASTAQMLRFSSTQQGKYVRSTTLGSRDRATLSCADTQGVSETSGPGERYFELDLPAARVLNVDVFAAFDAAVEVRQGPCSTVAAAVIGCANNPSASHKNPSLTTASLAAGTYCVVVDGVDGGTFANSGAFDLSVRLSSPL